MMRAILHVAAWMIFAIVLLDIATTTTLAHCDYTHGSVCPMGFTFNENLESCYNFVISEKTTWYNALTFCNSMDANLVAIDSEEEYNFLRSEIQGRGIIGDGATTGNSFFIGGNFLNGGWQWAGGPSWKTKPILYAPWSTTWSSPEPNDVNAERCTVLYGGEQFKLHNWNCGFEFHYICEIKLR
ncbi:unnamed protein product [Owenia fusiformis]|uniref:C-type lectin domain-containing protein n=1 Tax=Owenia fusiformis TaxID=6347 RepID=A0A8S4NCG1_OWEFU|nr:unnamed protein product [Owenia fusiformis]